jgi:predicted ATPase
VPGPPERDELFAALLRQVTGDDQLDVIVIEDIHWADEATLDLMRFSRVASARRRC